MLIIYNMNKTNEKCSSSAFQIMIEDEALLDNTNQQKSLSINNPSKSCYP